MTIFLIQLRSTGQVWNQYVCKTYEGVRAVLDKHKLTEIVYEGMAFEEWRNPDDSSQTATCSEHETVD